ncbi:unnamed protein product [Phytophthora fragariaefolia]|uniref:Unnamed protein product n=1 Tax=Phytophthora fragariaefolia TaxID=1490495 RepID=A0A9W6U5B0_9STRA|nr:unnamed protein product [Phytophthora fragariaefolia]
MPAGNGAWPGCDLLLGRDHLAGLGIGVSKLPFTTTAETAATAPLPEEDEADYVLPRVFGTPPEYDKYRDKVPWLLDAKITANQDTPLVPFETSQVVRYISSRWMENGATACNIRCPTP